jgi:class 3 adenylate cyclase/tetratricopeptide (TPR) repeat protein
MNCPKCQFENPERANYCIECGHNLSPARPSPKVPSFEEKLDKIQRYLPKGLTEKILAQRNKIEGERKQVTVMFCDMEGFTPLVDGVGPEEAYGIMDEVYEILIHKVHDYDGTVNEMTGDGIMALFGAPIALEDAPQRALRSALSIHREIARFNEEKWAESSLPPIKMRVGIHSGPVVVGTLGNDLRVEFKAVGGTVNLASRMEGLAEPGTTYVTEETFRLTEGFFRFEALGRKQVKGKAVPVEAYRVIAPSTRRTRFDVSAERGLTPFVGRERELQLLVDGFARAKGNRGQAFSIVSEAGVGKSRLLYEFRKAVANENATFLEGKCLSYSKGVSYHPVIDILKSNFDILESDGDLEIREKVKRGLKILGADEASTLPYLLELLSVKESGLDKISMSPEARKDRIVEALKRIVLKGSQIRPLILAFEDLHWVDKSSEDTLRYLLDSIPETRVFLIFSYRPEFVPTWGPRPYHSRVNLDRLADWKSVSMVTHLLGTADIHRDLEHLILEKTEGVPFFIEEFIKSLQDLGLIERKDDKYHLTKDIHGVIIPSTIQDVVMARADSLPEGAKEVLQTGSGIEREFSYELIKQVTGLPEQELLSRLSVLKHSELIYERGIHPQSTYLFRHALTREVVYDSMLTKRKKKLHEEIGYAMEDLYKENIDEHYGRLAEHFIEGDNYEKGADYSKLAQRKAEKIASLNDAIQYARKRIACLERLPRTDDVQKRIIDARTTLGLYITQMVYPTEAKEAVDPVIDLAIKHGYKRRLSQIYTILGTYYYLVEEDFPKTFKYLEEALKISEDVNDIVSLLFANFWLGLIRSVNCEYEKAVHNINRALDVNVAAKSLWGISVIKSNLSYYVYYLQGRVNLGYQTSYEAVRLAEESGDILSEAMAFVCHGICCYGKGFLEASTKHLLKGVDSCERINLFLFNAMAQFFLGETYLEIGEFQKSKDHYGKAIRLSEHHRIIPSWMNIYKVALARAKVMNNEKDIDLESLCSYVDENKAKIWDGWMRRYIGEIVLDMDDHHITEAEDWINKAIEADKRNGVMLNLGRDYALYSELLRRKGDQSKAKVNLNKALEIFMECGADGFLKKAEKQLPWLS